MSEKIYYERTNVGGGKIVTTKGPKWSGTSTLLGGRPRIITERNAVYVMGDGLLRHPPEFSFTAGSEFDTIEREGLTPVRRFKSKKLRTLSWKVSIGYRDWKRPVDFQVRWLMDRAERHEKIRFTGHGSQALEHGRWWVIDDFQVNVTQRTPTGLVSRADVTLSLVEASDVPATAAKRPKPKPKKKAKPKPKPKKKERSYKMRKGDTLWELAQKYYKNPYKWRILAKRNKIKNVRRIPIGKIIYIP